MDNPKCPKCGAEVDDFRANKRNQLVGKCPGCGKWGNLVSSGSKAQASAEAPSEKAGEQTKKAAPTQAASRAHRTGASGGRKPAKRRLALGSQRPLQKQSEGSGNAKPGRTSGIFGTFREFLDL